MQKENTIKNLLIESKLRLGDCGINTYSLDAELLLCEVLSCSREYFIGYSDRVLNMQEITKFNEFLERRIKREPISHILGRREFWGMNFKVTPDTLAPRPDSETLIESVLELFPDKNKQLQVLDLGTGTGCLLLSILQEFKNAEGVGIDASAGAISVAKENSVNLGLAKRANFILKSWHEGVAGQYDLIISNPPYIKDSDIDSLELEVADYEPHSALFGGDDGLACYRELAPVIKSLLKPDGFAVLEFGIGQHDLVREIMAKSHLDFVSYKKDLAGIIRCIVLK